MFKYSFLLILLVALSSPAGMLVDKTRVIFNAGENTQGMTIMNVNDYPSFVQLWVDFGEVDNFKQSAEAPFILIPPIFNLRSNEIKSIKLIYNGTPLPTDRESLYWINIYEVPAIKQTLTKEQYLLMSMKTQIKLIYRPAQLTTGVSLAGQAVACSIKPDNRGQLVCRNNTGYYLSYNKIDVVFDNQQYKATRNLDLMIAPFSESSFSLTKMPQQPSEAGNRLIFNLINDQGEIENIVKKF